MLFFIMRVYCEKSEAERTGDSCRFGVERRIARIWGRRWRRSSCHFGRRGSIERNCEGEGVWEVDWEAGRAHTRYWRAGGEVSRVCVREGASYFTRNTQIWC